jgi:hypothetical protein
MRVADVSEKLRRKITFLVHMSYHGRFRFEQMDQLDLLSSLLLLCTNNKHTRICGFRVPYNRAWSCNTSSQVERTHIAPLL